MPKFSRNACSPGCSKGGAAWIIPLNRALFTLSTIVIVVLCLVPGDEAPQVGLDDKVEHAIAYALLTLLGLNACRSRKAMWHVVIFLLCLGLLVESLQSWVPGRSADVVDGLANVGGMIVAFSSRLAFYRLFVNDSR